MTHLLLSNTELNQADGCALYGHPEGWRGRVAGLLMARRNLALNERAVELLDAKPDDRVIEVGFGPGTALQRLALRDGVGLIAGVDASDVMLRQAEARLRPWVDEGRVLVKQACATALPFGNEMFDRALVVDSATHWPSIHHGLRELARVLKPHGRVVVAERLEPGAPSPERMVDQLHYAGFRTATLHTFQWDAPTPQGAAVLAVR
jgi:ubiquinone/menaquinone biosynthesis C-methylase UbiE